MFGLQKWSKGKQKEKVNNAVLFDQASYDKMLSEVPKFKQITPSVLSERLRVWILTCFRLLYFLFVFISFSFCYTGTCNFVYLL